jgi:hypothetical protein
MHGIEFDEVRDEIIVPQSFAQAILTFRGGASGEEPPIRMIQGPRTQLTGSSRLALDTVNGELYVPQRGSVLVFPREANGDVAPTRILTPDSAFGGNVEYVAVDPANNVLVVLEEKERQGEGVRLSVFNRTDQGKVKPRAVIGGPKSGLDSNFQLRVYNGWILVSVPGPVQESETETAFVGVWSIHDQGDVPPRYRIGGPQGSLKKPRGIAIDPEHQAVIISDKHLNAVFTYAVPEVFRSPSTAAQ